MRSKSTSCNKTRVTIHLSNLPLEASEFARDGQREIPAVARLATRHSQLDPVISIVYNVNIITLKYSIDD